jgi:hypothetical protein
LARLIAAAPHSKTPATASANSLRMITKNVNGHIHNTFVGEPNAWMNQFAGPVKYRAIGNWKTESTQAH